jgi:hypothetical protein
VNEPHTIVVHVYFRLLDAEMAVAWNPTTQALLDELDTAKDGVRTVYLAGTKRNGMYKADRERFDHSRLRIYEIK